MKLFLLPGSDIANKDWIERVQPILAQHVDETQIQYYQHWKEESSRINVNREVGTFLDRLNAHQGSYGVFAKSAGILVALEALAEAEEAPDFAIFAGFPLGLADQLELDLNELLDSIDFPVLFIQNANDPAGSAENLRRITTRLEDTDFLLLPGNTHDYPVVGNTANAIEEFIAEHS